MADESTIIEAAILSHLETSTSIPDTWGFASANNYDHQNVVGVLKSLLVDQYVADEQLSTSFWTLTEEGNGIAASGSVEYQVQRAPC